METAATAVLITDAVRDAQVVVSIPSRNLAKLRADLFDGVLDNVIFIDTNNYHVARDARVPTLNLRITAYWVQMAFPLAPPCKFRCMYTKQWHVRDSRPKFDSSQFVTAPRRLRRLAV